jgi:hypothetical protein
MKRTLKRELKGTEIAEKEVEEISNVLASSFVVVDITVTPVLLVKRNLRPKSLSCNTNTSLWCIGKTLTRLRKVMGAVVILPLSLVSMLLIFSIPS